MSKTISNIETSLPEVSRPAERLKEKLIDIEICEVIEQFSLWGKLSAQNLENMKAIQKIILFEEGQALTLDEVLVRILLFYRRFVPYNAR